MQTSNHRGQAGEERDLWANRLILIILIYFLFTYFLFLIYFFMWMSVLQAGM